MKVKQTPDDFRVEELTNVEQGHVGDFAFYRLCKRGWTTPDALAAIRRLWNLDQRAVSHGGLKDRHADTIQYLSIRKGPARDLEHFDVRLEYLGQIRKPFGPQDISSNRFTITLRSLSSEEAAYAQTVLNGIGECGIPNYFDDQRFGSVGFDGRFVARELIRQDYEEALKLAIVSANPHDKGPAKKEKAILREHWGNWATCKDALPRGHARSLVDYLRQHPGNFKGAVARLRPELRGLYLSAYQSHIWNRTLAEWLQTKVGDEMSEMRLRLGAYPVPQAMPEEIRTAWQSLEIPLASARMKFDPEAPWAPALSSVLASEGLTLGEMKVRAFDRPYFTRGERAACVWPTNLTHESSTDEKHRGRMKVVMSFELPRGVYATMLIKLVSKPT